MKHFIWTRLLLLSFVLLSACKERIVHDLSELEANRIISLLEDTDISAYKERQADAKWSISVAGSQSSSAIKIINASRLLLNTASTSSIGGQAGIMSSRESQRFSFERALSQEIEATLLSLSGVLQARVHLNLPVRDPIFDRPLKGSEGSASVLIIASKPLVESKEILSELVSGAAGISPERVSVVVHLELEDKSSSSLKTSGGGETAASQNHSQASLAQPWYYKFIGFKYVAVLLLMGLLVATLGIKRLRRGYVA